MLKQSRRPVPTYALEGLPARPPQTLPLFTDTELVKLSSRQCSGQGSTPDVNGLSWSSRSETNNGRPLSAPILRNMISTSGEYDSALATVVRRISAGEITLLPAPACRDLAVAVKSAENAIRRAARAASDRGDWNPATIPAYGVDTWRSERVDERRERIEALGDSNPPAMAEAVGYMLMEAA